MKPPERKFISSHMLRCKLKEGCLFFPVCFAATKRYYKNCGRNRTLSINGQWVVIETVAV